MAAATEKYMADPMVVFDAEDRSVLQLLEGQDGVLYASWNGAIQVTLDTLDRLPDLVIELVKAGARLTRVEPVLPTLEQLYFEMQRAHREDE